MDSFLTFLSRKRWPLVAALALLFAPFTAATSYADEVPFRISYTGTLTPIPVDLNDDDALASVIDAQSKGTFGASMSHIVTEWIMIGLCQDGSLRMERIHAAIVVTFSNGDQLFGAGSGGGGWMCLDVLPGGDGSFYGEAYGDFTDGTGRFEGAHGAFTSPFTGTNLTATEYGYTFGWIQGSFEGTLTLP